MSVFESITMVPTGSSIWQGRDCFFTVTVSNKVDFILADCMVPFDNVNLILIGLLMVSKNCSGNRRFTGLSFP